MNEELESTATASKARYLMIGGFLGAGKTTTIQRFAEYLVGQGKTVGLITNDQGGGLVDSAIGRANEFPVEEIGGGCFCCRFNSLIEAARSLTEETRPDVLLAEPVGSCTDLVATVSLPLQKIYGDAYSVAPFSVLMDPVRALRILGVEEGKKFSPNVLYIYRKQLEEADALVINKIDLLSEERQKALRFALEKQFPGKKVFEISAREGLGLEPWFDWAYGATDGNAHPLEIDYQKYGEGEALLGWLNATIHLEGEDEFEGNALLKRFALALREALGEAGESIAHLKMTLTPRYDPFELGAINLVREDSEPELSHRLVEPLEDGELLLNIRAEAAPEVLESALAQAGQRVFNEELGLSQKVSHIEHFRPGQPQPTHRMAE